MAADTIKNVISHRDNIRRLMAMDTNGTMDRIAAEAQARGAIGMVNEDGVIYTPQQPIQQPMQPQATPMVNEDGVIYNPQQSRKIHAMGIDESTPINPNSKMPKAVIESFKRNPGKTANLPSGLGGSVLDGFKYEPVQPSQPQRSMVTEQYQVGMQTMPQTSGIDYSLIKTIIDESVDKTVKKYVSALSKKLISEGVGAGNGANKVDTIMLGDKFNFCDSDGNLYEATLKFKKNIKKKVNG